MKCHKLFAQKLIFNQKAYELNVRGRFPLQSPQGLSQRTLRYRVELEGISGSLSGDPEGTVKHGGVRFPPLGG